ncbi:unnamed protein product, partial [Choristocarpus tenellus]
RVEKRGYTALEALGATKLQRVATAGGGAANPTWNLLRERILGVPTGRLVGTRIFFFFVHTTRVVLWW